MQEGSCSYNPKRKIASELDKDKLKELASKVKYRGSPYHKRNPGDFGLTPPVAARPDKTLCDGVSIYNKMEAQRLLELGVLKGLISEQIRGEYPQNIWVVAESGIPLEAQLDNRQKGTYHGYPLSANDPFAEEVLRKWNQTRNSR